MPRVPTLRPGQITTQATPNVRVSTEAQIGAFGGGPALQSSTNEAIRLGNQAQKIIEEEKKRADDLATTQYFNEVNKILNDEQTNYQKKRGQDVLTKPNPDGTRESYDFVGEYEDNVKVRVQEAQKRLLRNQSQRDIGIGIDSRLLGPARSSAQRYFFSESNKAQSEELASARNLSKERAALNWHNPTIVSQSKNEVIASTMQDSVHKGLSDEGAALAVHQEVSSFHKGILDSMVSERDVNSAKEYLEKNKNEMTARDFNQFNRSFEAENTRQESLKMSDAILAKGLGLGSSLNEASKINDVDVQDQTKRRIRQAFSDRRAAENLAYQKIKERAINAAFSANDPDAVDAKDWVLLKAQDQAAILRLTEQRRNNVVVSTDEDAYNAYKAALSNPATQVQAAKEGILPIRHLLSEPDAAKLNGLAQGILEEDEKSKKILDDYLKTSEAVRTTLVEAGFEVGTSKFKPTTNKKKAKKLRSFVEAANNKIEELRVSKGGKPPTDTEVQNIIDGLVIDVEVKGRFVDPDKKAFEVKPTDTVLLNISQIPGPLLERIKAGLKARNMPVTEAEILKRYAFWLQGPARE